MVVAAAAIVEPSPDICLAFLHDGVVLVIDGLTGRVEAQSFMVSDLSVNDNNDNMMIIEED